MSQKPHISFLIKVFLFFVAFNVSYITVQPVVAQKAKTTRTKVASKTTTSTTKNKKAAKPVDKKTLLKNEQAATQRKRQQSQQQIQVINRNIKANLDSVLIIDHRISKQISSIDSLDRQIRQLNANIDTLNSQIKQIKKELLDKKKKYANAMIYMQKHKSVQEKLMFIFSADNLAQIIKNVNNQLCEGNTMGLFVTVWLGVIDITTGEGVSVNAGHEHPVIRHVNGKYEFIKYKHSPAVATMEGLPFKQHTFKMEPGDSIFVYTDGVPEATNNEDELWGGERMLAALNKNPDAKPEQVLENVMAGINEFVDGAKQFDDITMLCMSYRGM